MRSFLSIHGSWRPATGQSRRGWGYLRTPCAIVVIILEFDAHMRLGVTEGSQGLLNVQKGGHLRAKSESPVNSWSGWVSRSALGCIRGQAGLGILLVKKSQISFYFLDSQFIHVVNQIYHILCREMENMLNMWPVQTGNGSMFLKFTIFVFYAMESWYSEKYVSLKKSFNVSITVKTSAGHALLAKSVLKNEVPGIIRITMLN